MTLEQQHDICRLELLEDQALQREIANNTKRAVANITFLDNRIQSAVLHFGQKMVRVDFEN